MFIIHGRVVSILESCTTATHMATFRTAKDMKNALKDADEESLILNVFAEPDAWGAYASAREFGEEFEELLAMVVVRYEKAKDVPTTMCRILSHDFPYAPVRVEKYEIANKTWLIVEEGYEHGYSY